MKPVHKTLRNLVSDERGSALMTFGMTSIIACVAVGGAIDFGKAYQQKSKMQNALDAAVVSAVGKFKETNDFNSAANYGEAIFKSVFNNALRQPAASVANPNPAPVTGGMEQPVVKFEQSGGTVVGTARMTTNTPFLKLAIGTDLNVGANSIASPPSGKKLEVAMMVDLTGSMGWNAAAGASSAPCNMVSNPDTKIEYLQCAGEDLLNILLPANGANDTIVRIGIAPFSDKVNAGEYASAVTGLAATGGSFTPITNLASTKQSVFTGTYSSAGAQPSGSQWGATGAVVPAGGTVSSGATFSNSYCASPTSTTTGLTSLRTSRGYRIGVEIPRADDEYHSSFNPSMNIAGVITLGNSAPSSDGFRKIIDIDGEGSNWVDVESNVDIKGYFVPLPVSTTGLTVATRTARHSGSNWTGNIGASVPAESSLNEANLLSWGFMKATSSNGYWRIDRITDPEGPQYVWTTSGWYIPIYTTLTVTTTTTNPGCESTTTTSNSKLISCVTERLNGTSLDYTADAVAAGRYVGPFNHGNTSKSNYSSDGKCYTSGRELPAVMPLTNNRTSLMSFFQNVTVGGATAGHLGTAWASYILSPNWSSIWPSNVATAYNSQNTIKAAILMTDGEYNIQFSMGGSGSNVSAKQALMLCKQMRDNGIKVYTVGFGFAENASPPTTNIEAMSETDRTTPLSGNVSAQTRALDTLAKCASSNSSYYFPYDGQALRQVFKNIANSLSADLTGGNARLTN